MKIWQNVSWCRKGGSVVKLNEVEVGSTVTVKKIEGDGAYKDVLWIWVSLKG